MEISVHAPINPKDREGILKIALSYVPIRVVAETALGMMEGGFKYGRANYRVSTVIASVYYDATMRHLAAWWEGEDIDKESKCGLHHVSKAIASLTVLRDAMLRENGVVDDRPPASEPGWIEALNSQVRDLQMAYPNPVAPFTQVKLEAEAAALAAVGQALAPAETGQLTAEMVQALPPPPRSEPDPALPPPLETMPASLAPSRHRMPGFAGWQPVSLDALGGDGTNLEPLGSPK